ncbi:MAG: tyrosine-type recombinase/integrase [Acidimicrobiia bacterium]
MLAGQTAGAVDAMLAGRGHPEEGPLIASRRTGEALTPPGIRYALRTVAKAAGIGKRLHPHAVRHTAITLALDAGVSLRDVQDFAGHSNPNTTRRYDAGRWSLDRHATYVLEAYLSGA